MKFPKKLLWENFGTTTLDIHSSKHCHHQGVWQEKKYTGPDFKRFRKNTVMAATKKQSFVRLRSVLPRESEQQRDFDDQRQALEEQHRKADELFRDHPATKKRTKTAHQGW